MAWDHEEGRLRTVKSFRDMADQTLREIQSGERSHIDPTGSFLTVEVYEGVVTTFPLFEQAKKKKLTGRIQDPFTSRIPEFFTKSSAFVQNPDDGQGGNEPRLAMIYEDNESKPRLRIRRLSYDVSGSVEFIDITDENSTGPKKEVLGHSSLEFGASHIIPLEEAPFGLLILGETGISYYSDTEYVVKDVKPLPEATVWAAWDRIDNMRYVLTDEYCQLWMLMIRFDGSGEFHFEIDKLGEISRATRLVYLGEGLLFVGAHAGDSQLVRIIERDNEVLQKIPNVAPILDFTIMDMGNRSTTGPSNDFSTGQARIVTCSGGWSNGSIRSVRSGVGMMEQAIIPDLSHATQLFSLSPKGPEQFLLVGFVDETRLFVFDEQGSVEEKTEFAGLDFDSPTLFAGLVNDDILQITPKSVRIVDFEGGVEQAQWQAPEVSVITATSLSDSIIALVVDGAELVFLDANQHLSIKKTVGFKPRQVSCVAISALLPGVCLVGFWQDSDVSVVELKTGKTVGELTLSEDGVAPRSIVITKLYPNGDPTTLFSMADGHVISYAINPSTYAPKNRTVTVLGTKQPDLQQLPRLDGTFGVFVASEHPSLIYADEGRLSFSAVDSPEQVYCVAPFNSALFPNAIVMATASEVKICQLHETRTTQVHPLYLSQTVRRLAYSPALRAFGLGTILRKVEDGAETAESSFKLVDEIMFKPLASDKMRQDELVTAVIRTELPDRYGQMAERFIVGTSFGDDAVVDNFRGRIIVYEVTEDRQLKILASQSVKTACQCLAMVRNDLVAALNRTIVVYSLVYTEGSSWYLKKQATERISTVPISIHVTGNQIAVSDIMKSLSILECQREGDEPAYQKITLVEIARHSETVWATALTQVQSNLWLQADAQGNLMVLEKVQEGATDEDRKRLRVIGEFRLGEMVNKMQGIEVERSGAVVDPKAFLATVRFSFISCPN
jgi:DNA damage-binding protein 1